MLGRVLTSVWRQLTTVAPAHRDHWIAVRAGVSVAMPLLLLWSLDRLDLALGAAFGAFTALYGRAHSHRPRAAMQATAAPVLVGGVGIGATVSTTGSPALWGTVAVAVMAAVATLCSLAFRWHPPGAIFAVFAVGATAGHPTPPELVGPLLGVASLSALFAMGISALGAVLPKRRRREVSWDAGVAAAQRSPAAREDVALTAFAVGTATWCGALTGIGHEYWAGVAAAAAFAATSSTVRVARAVMRSVGTVAGVLVAGLLLTLDPSPLATILVVVALQVVTEVLIGRNYVLALLTITPLALLMVHLASPAPAGELMVERVVMTVLGGAVGVLWVVVAHVARPRRDR